MAQILGILSAVVLALSAFVSYKVKENLTEQNETTKSEESKLATNNKTFKRLSDEITDLEVELDEATANAEKFNADYATEKKTLDGITSQIDEAQGTLDDTKKSVAEAKDLLDKLGPLKGLKPKIEQLNAANRELQDKIQIITAENSRLTADENANSKRSAAVSKILSDRNKGESSPDLKTRVRSYDADIGLVTLAAGDNSGVVQGSRLAVMRDGEKVTEIEVTAVAPNTATANIVRSTLKEGENVYGGDSVIAVQKPQKK